MTNDRPTPETDAELNLFLRHGEAHQVSVSWIEFARKLERERDEAREAAERWESSSDAMERAGAEQARRADENREWALKAERERDEAREETVQLLESSNRLISLLREQLTEARELCQELIDLVPFGLGQSDQPWSSQAIKNNIAAIKNKEHNCDFFKDMKGNCMACRP